MKREEIDKILEGLGRTKDRNIVIIDFGNVQKWEIEIKNPAEAGF